jgi:hypothetical protein
LASALPACRFDGSPVFLTSPRGVRIAPFTRSPCGPACRSSHRLARPFRASSRRPAAGTSNDRGDFHHSRPSAGGRQPSWASVSLQRLQPRRSACGRVSRSLSRTPTRPSARGQPGTRHSPTSAFRTPSPVFARHDLPGLLHPGNALGISPDLQGLEPPGAPCLSRGRSSLAVHRPRSRAAGSAPEVFSPRESEPPGGPKPDRGRYPPGLTSSKALPSSAVGSASRPFLSCAFRTGP